MMVVIFTFVTTNMSVPRQRSRNHLTQKPSSLTSGSMGSAVPSAIFPSTILEDLSSRVLGKSEQGFLSGLASVIQVPPSCAGLLPALGVLVELFGELKTALPHPGLDEVIKTLAQIRHALSTSDATPSQVRAIPDRRQTNAGYWLLLMLAGGGLLMRATNYRPCASCHTQT